MGFAKGAPIGALPTPRHIKANSRYVGARWPRPPTFATALCDLGTKAPTPPSERRGIGFAAITVEIITADTYVIIATNVKGAIANSIIITIAITIFPRSSYPSLTLPLA